MNGDEDLGQNIIMKGEKFHYNQEPSLVQFASGDDDLLQIPTCTDRHTVNCQAVCDESQTTGCTESRTPTSYPMRTWDWRDRFEGRKTWDYSTENRPF